MACKITLWIGLDLCGQGEPIAACSKKEAIEIYEERHPNMKFDVCRACCDYPGCAHFATTTIKKEEWKGPGGSYSELIDNVKLIVKPYMFLCTTHATRLQQSLFTRLRQIEDRLDDCYKTMERHDVF